MITRKEEKMRPDEKRKTREAETRQKKKKIGQIR